MHWGPLACLLQELVSLSLFLSTELFLFLMLLVNSC